MITGDNPLTACHVARELRFMDKSVTLILTNENNAWNWQNVDGKLKLDFEDNVKQGKIWEQYALCITGEVETFDYNPSPFYIHITKT
jgi:cation-transporting ATPase 13A1